MKLKGVLIDFGDTLAYIDKDESEKYRQQISKILEKSGHHRNLDEISRILDDLYYDSSKGNLRISTALWESFLKQLEIEAEPNLVKKLARLEKEYLPNAFRLYENVYSVLNTLKIRYKLSLVSNCATGLSLVLRHLDLTHFFNCIVLSCEIGARKPDKSLYLEALNRLHLKPEECIFVADEISDLEGARRIGMKTLLVRQGLFTTREAENPEFQPDFQCDKISDITKYL